MPNKISLLNPFSTHYHSWRESKHLPRGERLKKIALSALIGIPTLGIGGVAYFRHSVKPAPSPIVFLPTPIDLDTASSSSSSSVRSLDDFYPPTIDIMSASRCEFFASLDVDAFIGSAPIFFPNNHYALTLSSSNFSYNEDEATITKPTFTKKGLSGSRIIKLKKTHVLSQLNSPKICYVGDQSMCDNGQWKLIPHRNIISMSFNDGNGWGSPSRNAAVKSNEVILKQLEESLQATPLSSSDILRAHKIAILEAHSELVKHSAEQEARLRTGTTCPLVTTVAGNKAHISSVGDCTVFIINSALESIEEPTASNRGRFDAKDPGGRIGYYDDDGKPDFRNYFEAVHPLQPGDYVIICSDGVHDNLSPKYLNIKPNQLGFMEEEWDDNNPNHIKAHNEFMIRKLLDILRAYRTLHNLILLDQYNINDAINSYLNEVTEERKLYLLENPSKREPIVSEEYTGKLDHAGVLVYQHYSSK